MWQQQQQVLGHYLLPLLLNPCMPGRWSGYPGQGFLLWSAGQESCRVTAADTAWIVLCIVWLRAEGFRGGVDVAGLWC